MLNNFVSCFLALSAMETRLSFGSCLTLLTQTKKGLWTGINFVLTCNEIIKKKMID